MTLILEILRPALVPAVAFFCGFLLAALLGSFRLARARAAALRAQTLAEASAAAQEKALEIARRDIRDSFANLARLALDDNAAHSSQAIASLLAPFREHIDLFQRSFDASEDRARRDRSALCEKIDALARDSRSVSLEASNLSKALRGDAKLLGSWGELSLQRLLEVSGLQSPRDFSLQTAFQNGKARPDAILHLPGNRSIVIDSKLPFARYLDYVRASDSAAREAAAKAHVAALEAQIASLSAKDYPHLADLPAAPDFSILFVASEPALALALSRKPDLLSEAARRNVILAGPSSLLATLRVVALLWQLSTRAEASARLVEDLRKSYDQFVAFAESLLAVRSAIQRASDACAQSIERFSSGRGSLLHRIDALRSARIFSPKKSPPPEFAAADRNPETPGDAP